MESLTLYSGLSEFDLEKFIEKAIDTAIEEGSKKKNLWIFFDEFNTTSLQTIICEMMLDRVYSVGKKKYYQSSGRWYGRLRLINADHGDCEDKNEHSAGLELH